MTGLCISVCVAGYRDLEPDTFAESPVLIDRDAGDRQDLPGKEKSKTGMLPKSTAEQTFSALIGDPDSVISVLDDEPFVRDAGRECDAGYPLSMPDGVLHQVVEDLFCKGIGVYLQPAD
jgi:hypothetical protein